MLETTAARAPQGNIYYFHPDHLGTSTFLTDLNGNPYQFFLNLPFGETMGEQHSFSEDYESPYKFNGKELDSETVLYYYGARYYDPRISNWLSVDPMGEKYSGWNPYAYTFQNPINFIDPTGMEGEGNSPIYDLKGQFLGTDDQGFTGEAIFMDAEVFRLHGGYNNGTNDSKKGGISHQNAEAFGLKMDDLIGNDIAYSYTQTDADAINNVLTHIVSQIKDVDMSDLRNGKTSSSYSEKPNGLPYGKSSNGALFRIMTWADTYVESNSVQITIYLGHIKAQNFTVNNIQNLFVHEYFAHFKQGIPGGNNSEHAPAIEFQANHSTWKGTTEYYKDNFRGLYKSWTNKNLNK